MLQPLGDRVLVEPLEAEEKTAGGIILPEAAQEAPREGKIVSLGTGRTLDDGSKTDFSVKVGDVVIYTRYGGNEVEVGDKELLIIDESSLLAVKSED